MDESLFLILCLPWIILLLFSPPLSSTCPSRRMSIRSRFPSFFSSHLSWGHLEEIVLSIHPLSISSLLTAVFFLFHLIKNNQIFFFNLLPPFPKFSPSFCVPSVSFCSDFLYAYDKRFLWFNPSRSICCSPLYPHCFSSFSSATTCFPAFFWTWFSQR